MKNIIYLIIGIIVFASCSTGTGKVARDKKYGGTLRINMAYMPKSLYPPAIQDAISSQVLNMVHAGLVKFNPKNLAVMPCIARKWTIDSTNTVFTFHLNSNVFFHNDVCFSDNKGRKITARDFEYTFEILCTQDSMNNNFSSLESIVGASKYYEESKNGKPKSSIEGIKTINDSILQITIRNPNPAFVNILASPALSVLAKEAIEKYGKEQFIGAGPYILKEKPQKEKNTILVRSEKYFLFDGKNNQLPYIDTISISFNGSSQKELNLFFNGQIDMISGLLQSESQKIVQTHLIDFQSNPPKYILGSASEEKVQLYNLLYPYIKDFYTNGMNYIDFTNVYFDRSNFDSTNTK